MFLQYLFCLIPVGFGVVFVFDRDLSLILVPVGYFIGTSGLAFCSHPQNFCNLCLRGILSLLVLLGAVGASFFLLGPVLIEGLARISGFSGADEGMIIVSVASFFFGLWGLACIVAVNIVLVGRSMRAGAAAFVLWVIAAIMTAFWPLLAALLSGTAFSGLLVWHLRVFQSCSQADIPSRTP
ncbi:hypothetical protein SAMN05428964_1166 [Thalassospira xiamenensis]|uniref:Uncharacterized protein n=1 Tax=Thalassospira xiamenensis TaxID=220697 RepID=A0A285TYW4_9PROT|nr:hypothetical protein SAMN05428964_1166 [Thalassospira xiamenensis]